MTENPVEFSGSWNFGPELSSVFSVQVVVEEVIKNWGNGKSYTKKNNVEPHEAKLLALDIGKVKKQLNWVPKYNSVKAIEETVKWYRKNQENKKMYRECADQIFRYMDY